MNKDLLGDSHLKKYKKWFVIHKFMLLYKFLCSDLINMSILCIMLEKHCAILLSLPSWECGLKLPNPYGIVIGTRHSLRGSADWNSKATGYSLTRFTSLPSWECGLKYIDTVTNDDETTVTPFVGVRIEILPITSSTNSIYVTPFVGVRIEIAITGGKKWQRKCHSLRGSADWNKTAAWLL